MQAWQQTQKLANFWPFLGKKKANKEHNVESCVWFSIDKNLSIKLQ